MTPHRSSAFSVLVVCTANHCRSPFLEHVLQATSDLGGGSWAVSSAGTRVDAARPPHRLIVGQLAERGLVVDPGWRSRQLTAELIADADLIITADDDHRAAVAALDLAARQRTFPLLQLAAIRGSIPEAERAPVSDPAAWAAQLQAHRHQMPLDATLDLADPIGRPPRYFRRSARTMQEIVELLTGIPLGASAGGVLRRLVRR